MVRPSTTGPKHGNWRGGKYVSRYFYTKAKQHAATRNLIWEITLDDLDALYERQEMKCVYTGWDLVFGTTRQEQTASLDRRDSSLGYTTDNIQLVHKTVNQMKWNLPEEEFLRACKAVANG